MALISKTTVSAPGKLLFAGGYLVMESPNVGVVIAVDKRFYCTVEVVHRQGNLEEETIASTTQVIDIIVESPQFGQIWNYSFDKAQKVLNRDVSQAENTFVEKSIRISLLALLDENHKSLSKLKITIKGDNDFYSLIPHLNERGEPKTLDAALALPPFLPAARVDGKIVKTGLGSSACLVTSLVAALYHSLVKKHDEAFNADVDLDIIFRLAQISHCHSQGKVGSGFDVAAACYGSHIYERFPESLLADLLLMLESDTETTTKTKTVATTSLTTSLNAILYETKWEGGLRSSLTLPNFVQVMLADVSGGSESPSMARNVLNWKNKWDPSQPVPHWDDLVRINQRIAQLLQRLGSCQDLDEGQMESLLMTPLDSKNTTTTESEEVAHLLAHLREAAQDSRRHLKAMGDAAGVPIEPGEQTALIDATLEIPGVVAALVPGAGGYDAVACIYINLPRVRYTISDFWCAWTPVSVCPLTVQAATLQEGQGIQLVETQ